MCGHCMIDCGSFTTANAKIELTDAEQLHLLSIPNENELHSRADNITHNYF